MAVVCAIPPDEMYQALITRDRMWDGIFFVGVVTTGVFCRPTCVAKKPRRENVVFFTQAAQAMAAGFRPCKRCRPMQPLVQSTPPWIQPLLDKLAQEPEVRITEKDLAKWSLEPKRVRRYFQKHYGMTFSVYQRALRMGLARDELQQGQPLLETGWDYGYESPSGFREAFARLFGKPPGQAEKTHCLVTKFIPTPLGEIYALADDKYLFLLSFLDRSRAQNQLRALRPTQSQRIVPGTNAILEQATEELQAYFDGTLTHFQTPFYTQGTPLQQQVWSRIQRIPYGTTFRYAQIAQELGEPEAVHAVGRATTENPLALLIPCHRVVRSDGTYCNYSGGLFRKQWLLLHEQHTHNPTPQGPMSSHER